MVSGCDVAGKLDTHSASRLGENSRLVGTSGLPLARLRGSQDPTTARSAPHRHSNEPSAKPSARREGASLPVCLQVEDATSASETHVWVCRRAVHVGLPGANPPSHRSTTEGRAEYWSSHWSMGLRGVRTTTSEKESSWTSVGASSGVSGTVAVGELPSTEAAAGGARESDGGGLRSEEHTSEL